MSGREQAMWKYLRPKLVAAYRGDFWMRVENPALPGTPDVHWCIEKEGQGACSICDTNCRGMLGHKYSPTTIIESGWVELKHLDAWPTRSATNVSVPHWTMEQRSWFRSFPGTVCLLLRVGAGAKQDWVVVPRLVAIESFGHVNKRTLLVKCPSNFSSPVDWRQLRLALIAERNISAGSGSG